ncbi:MAG: histidine phosphatase family protein [Litorilinea sp.]
MKHLSIIRHAQAADSSGYARDFDRELTRRGKEDAARVGEALHELTPPIDWFCSSPAMRAQTSTEIIVAKLALDTAPTWQPEIYAAHASTLLTILARSPQQAEHVALVGHNPGLEDLATGLCATPSGRVGLSLSPAGVAHLMLEIDQWDQLRWGAANLKFLLHPKELRGRDQAT